MKSFNQSCFLVTVFEDEIVSEVVHGWENVIDCIERLRSLGIDGDLREELHDHDIWASTFRQKDYDDRCAFLSWQKSVSIVRLPEGVPYVQAVDCLILADAIMLCHKSGIKFSDVFENAKFCSAVLISDEIIKTERQLHEQSRSERNGGSDRSRRR